MVNGHGAARALLRLAAALLLVALLGPASARAQDAGDAPDDAETEAETESDPVSDYFVGNLLFVFYHELGHGLIHKLDLPVLGREEDAADQLATLMLMDAGTDSVGGEPVLTAALGWLDAWHEQDSAADNSDYFDEHSLDMQRYANIVCLVYGSDPQNYGHLITDWDLPAERAEHCEYDYGSALASWDSLMQDVWITDENPGPADNKSFTLEVQPARSAETEEVAQYVANQQIFDDLVAGMNANMVLPTPIHVVAKDCGEENAFYDPETSQITMCYEWLAVFMADAQKQAE